MTQKYDVPIVFDPAGGVTVASLRAVLDKVVDLCATGLVLVKHTVPPKPVPGKKPVVTLEFDECDCD